MGCTSLTGPDAQELFRASAAHITRDAIRKAFVGGDGPRRKEKTVHQSFNINQFVCSNMDGPGRCPWLDTNHGGGFCTYGTTFRERDRALHGDAKYGFRFVRHKDCPFNGMITVSADTAECVQGPG